MTTNQAYKQRSSKRLLLTDCRYLTADYERRNFSISQCSWENGAKSHIVAVKSPNDRIPPASHRISTGAIAGIAVGGSAVLIILILLGIILKVKRGQKKKSRQVNAEAAELDSPEKNPFMAIPEDVNEGHPRHAELDAVEHKGHEIDGRPYSGQEFAAQEQRFELDATERRSRTLSSPISLMSERSDATRLHQRQLSDPVSLTSEGSDVGKGHRRDISEPISPTSERSDAAKGHERKLSEPISPTSERSSAPMGDNRELSDPISPMRARSDADRLHKRELSDPVSLMSEGSDERVGTF